MSAVTTLTCNVVGCYITKAGVRHEASSHLAPTYVDHSICNTTWIAC